MLHGLILQTYISLLPVWLFPAGSDQLYIAGHATGWNRAQTKLSCRSFFRVGITAATKCALTSYPAFWVPLATSLLVVTLTRHDCCYRKFVVAINVWELNSQMPRYRNKIRLFGKVIYLKPVTVSLCHCSTERFLKALDLCYWPGLSLQFLWSTVHFLPVTLDEVASH